MLYFIYDLDLDEIISFSSNVVEMREYYYSLHQISSHTFRMYIVRPFSYFLTDKPEPEFDFLCERFDVYEVKDE